MNFINRLKYAEHKIFCICRDVKKYNKVMISIKIFDASSKFKIAIPFSKNKKMLVNILILNKITILEHLKEYIKLDMIVLD